MAATGGSFLALLAALAGPASGQPVPRPLTVLDVPFISQSEALCGGAAAAMVLRYWGERGVSAESFAHLVDRSAAGIRTTALIAELQAREWSAAGIRGTDAQIAEELARGRPVVALVEDRPGTYHYIVIVAATDDVVVFHDPARAPMRVVGRVEFAERWEAAGRWMAIILPRGGPALARPPESSSASPVRAPCAELIEAGVRHAQAQDLAAAERDLTAALICGGSAALRELAGVRLLQRRWADVASLAEAAVAADAADAHAWRLLGTSRFIQDDPVGALQAWNQVGEPQLDLVTIAGLERTRHRVVERLIGARPGETLTPDVVAAARRRLAELPAAATTRLDYVPVSSALAELRGAVSERPLVPRDLWTYAGLGVAAAARRQIAWSAGSWSGGGERLGAEWRFWRNRPRVAGRIAAPAPWGGVWDVDAAWDRITFDRAEVEASERTGAQLGVANWITGVVRLRGSVGIEEWSTRGQLTTMAADVRAVSGGDRVEARGEASVWAGNESFATLGARLTARSSAARRGIVFLASGGASVATSDSPPAVWMAGDTGHARTSLLRAHPLLDEGRLRSARLGRRFGHVTGEVQRWFGVSLLQVGAAAFADAAITARRLNPGALHDVDVGIGARVVIPGLAGVFRADIARGLRDGATAWSFVYEP